MIKVQKPRVSRCLGLSPALTLLSQSIASEVWSVLSFQVSKSEVLCMDFKKSSQYRHWLFKDETVLGK